MKKAIKKYFTYLHTDCLRAFTSVEFFIGIFGVFITLLWGCYGERGRGSSVVRLIWYSTFGVQFLLVMIFGAVPYAGSICEDLEYGYIQQILIRGNLKSYCICKTIAVFVSSVASFTAGMLLFVCVLRIKSEWIDYGDSVYKSAIHSGSFRCLLQNNHFCLYVILFSIQLGLLIGILALISAYISLFISNKLLVLTIPVIAYYFITQYVAEIFVENIYLNLNYIYGGTRNIFDNDALSFLYAVAFAFITGVVFTILIYCKLKRKIGGE